MLVILCDKHLTSTVPVDWTRRYAPRERNSFVTQERLVWMDAKNYRSATKWQILLLVSFDSCSSASEREEMSLEPFLSGIVFRLDFRCGGAFYATPRFLVT